MARRPAASRTSGGGQVPPEGEARAGGPADQGPFPGFERPGANFVLTPNQYLDLCVPHCSRGVMRVVGFLIRQVLGWSDRQGRPLRETVRVSYSRIIGEAGVSRGAAREALEEAEAAGFITRVRAGTPHRSGSAGRAAEFALKWDEGGGYAEALGEFRGFYTGEGRRTMVPNAFFDRVLPNEPHGVTKVVGAVLRHTVGYTNRYTGLPQESAPLSYRKLMAYAHTDRRTLRRALPAALEGRYVRVVSEGRFTPGDGNGEASVYAVCWRADGCDGSETPPASKATPPLVDRETVQKCPPAERSVLPLANGSNSPPASVQKRPPQRSRTAPTRKTASKTKQTQPPDDVLRDDLETEGSATADLRSAGLADAVARRLLEQHGEDACRRQLVWLDARSPSRNRAGMLRRAIEEAWPEPTRPAAVAVARQPRSDDPAAEQRAREAYERRHHNAYLGHLAEVERDLRERRRADYKRFEQYRAGRRRTLMAEAESYPPRIRERVLVRFDADESRLTELAEAFADDVPDFWTWDEQRKERAV